MCTPDHTCTLRTGDLHDVIVVGADPAGLATAMLLARQSLRVVLLDRRARPPSTAGTAPLLRAGGLLLSRWGLLDAIAATAPPITRTTLRYGDEVLAMSVKPSPGVEAFYAPPAQHLAATLEDAAIRAGVAIHRPAAVTDVITGRGRVVGVRALTAGHRPVDLGAPLVIGADGIHSTVADAVAAPLARRAVHASAGMHAYWSGLAPHGYEWIFGPGANAGIVPTAGGQSCLFVHADRPLDGRGPGVIRDALARLAPEWVAAVTAVGPARNGGATGPRWGYVRRAQGPGWALVGDAGFWKEPLGPHGGTDGLRDAELLARAVVDGLRGPDLAALDAALAAYEHERDRLGLPVFHVLDRLAGAPPGDGEVGHWLLQLGSAMADEVESLAALEPAAHGSLQAPQVGAG